VTQEAFIGVGVIVAQLQRITAHACTRQDIEDIHHRSYRESYSLAAGEFCRQLRPKRSIIIPQKPAFSNYRPISSLFVISKITERIVNSRITNHLRCNQLSNPVQSAYTVNFISLKLSFFHFTIILSMRLEISELPVSV